MQDLWPEQRHIPEPCEFSGICLPSIRCLSWSHAGTPNLSNGDAGSIESSASPDTKFHQRNAARYQKVAVNRGETNSRDSFRLTRLLTTFHQEVLLKQHDRGCLLFVQQGYGPSNVWADIKSWCRCDLRSSSQLQFSEFRWKKVRDEKRDILLR